MKSPIQPTNSGALLLAILLAMGANRLPAQDRPPQGNFDPEEMRQRMMQGMREQFEVKDDSEWKLISERVTKVMEARRAASSSGMGGSGFSGGFGGPRPQGGDRGGDRGTNRFQGGPPGFNREPNPELDALRKSIDAKASPAELKAKLAQLRAARQKKEAELEKARDELRIVLSVRQEAMAVASGLLK